MTVMCVYMCVGVGQASYVGKGGGREGLAGKGLRVLQKKEHVQRPDRGRCASTGERTGLGR